MRSALIVGMLVAASIAPYPPGSAAVVDGRQQRPSPREGRVRVDAADLFTREIGQGQPVIVLHGGPDFDHSYFLPDLDRLADGYRLIYYDQRGRGKSADGVRPEDVTLNSEIIDLEKVRESFGLGSAAILGHSWGAVLALEYAIRHPDRVSHLVLLNPAPVSSADFAQFRNVYRQKLGADFERLRAVAATAGYTDGEPDAVAAYYRIHFNPALRRPEDVDTVVRRLRASFTKAGILKARAVEDRLVGETWRSRDYDLLPRLGRLRIPTVVVYSGHDFIPPDAAVHIARAVPNARLIGLAECGHFSYMDCPTLVRTEIDRLFRR
jgi:proline iminopeptidase